MDEKEAPPRQSLLPYEAWAAEALRQVAVRALAYTAEHGLPGGHHFYLAFRTGHPGVEIPKQLRQRFPEEMTIVLQHQFWDLAVDEAGGRFSVGLSFGGVPAKLTVPFSAFVSFADPEVQLGLRFEPVAAPVVAPVAVPPEGVEGAGQADAPAEPAEKKAAEEPAEAEAAPHVVSLEAFRRRPTRGKE
ncbi:MAG: SspB family protein [Acetobacteraceae bacterium]